MGHDIFSEIYDQQIQTSIAKHFYHGQKTMFFKVITIDATVFTQPLGLMGFQ